MKIHTTLLIGLLFALTPSIFAAGPAISFKETSHDFGTIKEADGDVTYDFTFTNKGDSPLLIYRALASCGCTNPEFSKAPIAPGATSTIRVTFSTMDRPGSFHKTITLYTNDKLAPNVVLIISGEVMPMGSNPETNYPFNLQGLRINRNYINILQAKIGSIKSEVIEMMNTTNAPLNIQFSNVPKHIHIVASNTKLKPNETGVITLKYMAELAKDYGKREDSFYLYTNEKYKTNPTNKIQMVATITEDFSNLSASQLKNAPIGTFSESRIDFGKMTKGSSKTLTVNLTNTGKSNLLIRKIIPEYNGIIVNSSTKTIPPGKFARISITLNAGTFEGSVVQRVTFYSNDPRSSINRIFLTAQVSAK